jgi:hypothetical protein
MLKHRRSLTWLWWAWASTPVVVALGSLLIGYLRSRDAPDLRVLRDSLEAVVGLSLSALVCLPLVIGASYLDQRWRSSARSAGPPRWLAWLPLLLVPPLGFWMLLSYLFGSLGISIRVSMMSLFEPG